MFCLTIKRIFSVKIGLFVQEITFITEFPGSNFLLPMFLTGDKLDFQVANLLLISKTGADEFWVAFIFHAKSYHL